MEPEISKVELEHLTSWTSALTNKLEVMFFKIFFLWRPLFKVFIEFVTISFLFYALVFLALRQGSNPHPLHWKMKL